MHLYYIERKVVWLWFHRWWSLTAASAQRGYLAPLLDDREGEQMNVTTQPILTAFITQYARQQTEIKCFNLTDSAATILCIYNRMPKLQFK